MPEISYLSVMELRGADATEFLHRQLTADIRSLQPGGATFACLCSLKGRVIALLNVRRQAEGLQIICQQQLADQVATHLQRFVMRDDVSINRRDDLVVTAEIHAGALPLYTGATEVEGSATTDLANWKRAEMEAGIVWLDESSSDQFLPQMLGMEGIGALSFRKGCYPGQEVIARTHYLGKLKRRPVIVETGDTSSLQPGETVQLSGDGQTASAVVVDQVLDNGKQWSFAVVRSEEPFIVTQLQANDQLSTTRCRWLEATA